MITRSLHLCSPQNGKLLYSNMKKVWGDYPEDLHPWLLRLTEEFDLTFPLLSEDANIVPCLLPAAEPKVRQPVLSDAYKIVFNL